VTDGETGTPVGPEGPAEEPILITPDMLAPRRPAPRPPDPRIDFERGIGPLPPVVLAIMAANVAVFIWEVNSGAFVNSKVAIEAGALHPSIIAAGALIRAKVLAGEWWRMVTAMFLHGGIDHLIGNMFVLYIVGMACEHGFGAARTALIYLGSGLTGSALSLAMGPGPSVGASGAIFGVLAAVVVMLYRYQKRFQVRDKRVGFVLAAWAGWQLLTGFVSPFIDNFAHLGGMLGGTLAALWLVPQLTAGGSPRPPSPRRGEGVRS
jgi:rhomboid protease GluP